MDLHSDSDSDSEDATEETARTPTKKEQRNEAGGHGARPNEETNSKPARECGSPGCDLADFHLEACRSQQVTGRRQRQQPRLSVCVQEADERAGEAEEAEAEAEAKVAEAEAEADVEAEVETEQVEEEEAEEKAEEATEEEAGGEAAQASRRRAEAEGLTLQPSSINKTGYVNVNRTANGQRFVAHLKRAGKTVHIGSYGIAKEAALAYARTPEAKALMTKPAPLTAKEARARAAMEGLTLEPSTNTSGYKGVGKVSCNSYRAEVERSGKRTHLGSFVTAEEAALVVTRAIGNTRTVAPSAPPSRTTASHQKAAKRAALPLEAPRSKQIRQAAATLPPHATAPPSLIGASAAVPARGAPPVDTLLQKVARIKAVLELDANFSLGAAIKAANELMGMGSAQGATSSAPTQIISLPSQVDALLANIGI